MEPELTVGTKFGEFTLVELLGRGPASAVYRADHPALGRDLALKILQSPDESLTAAAQQMCGVDHPAIVPVYDTGVIDGRAWLAMRCITGIDLRAWLQQNRPSVSEVTSIVRQIASALDALHHEGLSHGDVKPSNILLTIGTGAPDKLRAYLVDPVPADSQLLTLDYAAPERIPGSAASPSTDQYSLGIVAYECLAGVVPFPKSTPEETIRAHLEEELPMLPQLGARADATLSRILTVVLGTALAKRPADRFASCAAIPAALERAEIAAASEIEGPQWPTATRPDRLARTLVPEWTLDSPAAAPPHFYPTTAPPPPMAAAPPAPPFGGANYAEELSAAPEADADDVPFVRPDWAANTNIGIEFDAESADRPITPIEAQLEAARAAADVDVERQDRSGDGDDIVDCSVFAPPVVSPGGNAMVQVFVHLPEQKEDAARDAVEFDAQAQRCGARTLEAPIARGERLAFDLSIRGIEVPEPVQTLVWQGRPAAVQFELIVPHDFPSSQSGIGTVSVSRRGVPIGCLKFTIRVADAVGYPVVWKLAGEGAKRFKRAFVSYASGDRAAVLARVQVLRAACIEYFQDVDLEPGQRWEQELYKQIDDCDLFLLFWSNAAKESEWVRREVDYALGLGDKAPDIRPVPIEGPPVPLPWDELSHLHFDDRLLSMLAVASR